MKLSNKIFAFAFVIASVALSAVAVHTVNRVTDMLTEQATRNLASHVTQEARFLETAIHKARTDVLALASTRAAQTIPEIGASTRRDAFTWDLQSLFETLLEENPAYTQIRLLGRQPDGRELVRLNQIDGVITRIAGGDLQTKGERYYYKETMALAPGQVFASKVDLNRELGRIVTPHQPVLRIATPVTEPDQHNVGVVIINIDLDVLLAGVTPVQGNGYLVVTNEAGDYLSHPDRSRTFAFEFGQEDRLPVEFGLETQWAGWLADGTSDKPIHFAIPDNMLALGRFSVLEGGAEVATRTLVLGGVVPLAFINEKGDNLRRHLYVTLTAVCMLLAVALASATSFLTRPITELTDVANRIAGGEQDVEVPVRTKDEIGVLAQDLDKMLAALRESAKSKELATLGRMAAMVAHDLRNALSSVKVNLQVLEQSMEDSGGPQAKQFDIALHQVDHMEEILQDLLAFARHELPVADWHEIAEIVRTATFSMLPVARERGITFDQEGLDKMPRVRCDRTKLIQVFHNLIGNAVQAMGDDGNITFRGKVVPGADGAEVRIDVVDTGPGIAPEIVDHLFEPFVTTRAKGTGLGLAIVRRIVEDHDGRMEVESRDGEGATMTVVLPVAGPGALSEDDTNGKRGE